MKNLKNKNIIFVGDSISKGFFLIIWVLEGLKEMQLTLSMKPMGF